MGLAAQRTTIDRFLTADDMVVAEFMEVQSGKKDERQELWKALACAKKHDAKLLIAKLDRFSRRVSFIAGIMEEGIGLAVAEMPNATDFQLHIFAALAQEERRLISQRTRAALAEAKKRGIKLGKNAQVLADKHRREADDRAQALASLLLPMVDCGMSLGAMALTLNGKGVSAARGGRFRAQQVKNLICRLPAK